MTDTTDDYGYLLVHFIEDPDGYAEKIYMDISDGDNPHRWVPLNDGKPVLASHLGTTACAIRISSAIPTPARGISSPPICVCSEATAAAGTSGATTPARISSSGNPTICSIGASRACSTCPASRTAPIWSLVWPGHANASGCRTIIRKAITVGAAHSSCIGPAPCSMMRTRLTTTRTSTAPCCGAPPPIFTQDTFEYGGVFIDNHGDAIDTTMIQRPLPDGGVRTYRITKDNAHGTGIWMDAPTRSAGGSRERPGPRCRTGLAQATCRTATPAAWKVLRCSPTTTTTVDRTTNGTCSWT